MKPLTLLTLTLYFLVVLILFNLNHSYALRNVISRNETIVSPRGRFELGFFTPGASHNWYLGIWYKNITVHTVIWVANREAPLRNPSSAALRLVPTGNLIIVDTARNTTVWSSNSSWNRQTLYPTVLLLDSGNLIVVDTKNSILWQSFDHPTDTFLSGMALGLANVYLTSWKSVHDPSPGEFTMHVEQSGYPQVFIKKSGSNQVRAGPWNGLYFSGTPYASNQASTFDLQKNRDGLFYLMEHVHDPSRISRVTLSPDGVSHMWVWADHSHNWVLQISVPIDNCDAYDSCGAYGSCTPGSYPLCKCLRNFVPKDPKGWDEGAWSSSGCLRQTPLDCGAKVGFMKYSDLKLPDARNSWYNETMTLNECRVECLKNCSCTAYTTLNISGSGSGCLIWFGDLVDIRALAANGQDLYVKMASSDLARPTGKSIDKLVVCLTIVGTVFAIAGIVLFLWKNNKKGYRGHTGIHNDELKLPLFDMSTVLKATKSFSIQNKLGEGGFGPVYKGTLENGRDIAVKRLSKTSRQGLEEFKNEVSFIAKLQHRNLVKLLGYCIQSEENMLIYEYMPNKSLDTLLFDEKNRMSLDWRKRFHIVNGIARGMVYLHHDSHLRIIHRDLKASNILLDNDMNPKISDFGIAKRYRENVTEDKTLRVVGTYGYMSPEYAICGRFSEKSDVFSFGVIVLETVSGKRNNSYFIGDRHSNLLGEAWILYMEGRPEDIVDHYLHNTTDSIEEMVRLIHIGLLCVQQHRHDRPSMTSVVAMLNNECELLQPNRPGFFMEPCTFSNLRSSNLGSPNGVTFTVQTGR